MRISMAVCAHKPSSHRRAGTPLYEVPREYAQEALDELINDVE